MHTVYTGDAMAGVDLRKAMEWIESGNRGGRRRGGWVVVGA